MEEATSRLIGKILVDKHRVGRENIITFRVVVAMVIHTIRVEKMVVSVIKMAIDAQRRQEGDDSLL